MVNKLLCFLFRHRFFVMKIDHYGHESIECEIRHYKCSRCGKKKEEREDY